MSSGERTLADDLARYMDNEAFTATRIGKARAEHMAMRRSSAKKRAEAALRFFSVPDHIERLQRHIERRK